MSFVMTIEKQIIILTNMFVNLLFNFYILRQTGVKVNLFDIYIKAGSILCHCNAAEISKVSAALYYIFTIYL